MTKEIPILILCLGLFLQGCTRISTQNVALSNLSDCPKESETELLSHAFQYDATTPTHRLECVLNFLRNTSDKTLIASSLASQVSLHLAERTQERLRQEALAMEGVGFAEKAIASGGSNDGGVHYYLAANLGLAVRDHVTQAAENLPRLEKEMQLALKLNPDIDSGGPLRLLGTLYFKAPPWPTGIGDGDKALDLLKKAVEQHPEHPLNHLFYAQALLEVDEQTSQARTELAKGLEKLASGQWGHNKTPWQHEFAELAKELGE